jgi:hypothetical protein
MFEIFDVEHMIFDEDNTATANLDMSPENLAQMSKFLFVI